MSLIPLLYIYAKNDASKIPVNDELTNKMKEAFEKQQDTGTYWKQHNEFVKGAMFKGIHECICGAESTCCDFLMKDKYVTNSLCVHYLRYHREEISEEELEKVRKFLGPN